MAGIYIHIPFCKRKCHYCNFFSTVSLKQKKFLLDALIHELVLRKSYLGSQTVESIYFGGGTPSVFNASEIDRILNVIHHNFTIKNDAEVTIEANPDDVDDQWLSGLRSTPVNRLSLGIQSFFDDDLKYLNRIHDKKQGLEAIEKVRKHGFDNISIDLIYGIPTLDTAKWIRNIKYPLEMEIPHISAYCLTVEPDTALEVLIKNGKVQPIEDDLCVDHFKILIDMMKSAGYKHYEISNFCANDHYSRHNRAYWFGNHYLGVGPSAHSYDGHSRQWNISSVSEYIRNVFGGKSYFDLEKLTDQIKYNEYVLTTIRTMWGTDSRFIRENFNPDCYNHFLEKISPLEDAGQVEIFEGKYILTDKGKLFADHISSELMLVE